MKTTHELLYFGLIHACVFLSLTCSLLLWQLRREGERSRKILAATWLAAAFFFGVRLYLLYRGAISIHERLPAHVLICDMISVIILSIYPAEVIHPGWIRTRTLLILASPGIALGGLTLLLQGIGMKFTPLGSLADIGEHIGEVDVLFRMLVLCAVILYSFNIFFIPHKGKYGNTDRKWIRTYCTAIQGILLFYVCNSLFGMHPFGNLHLAYYICFCSYITYQEVYTRLFIIPSQTETTSEKQAKETDTSPAEFSDTPLWAKLEMYMQSEEPWRNPDLTLPVLAETLHTNRTTLSAVIRAHGFDTFYDYLGYYRIEAFCRMVERNEVIAIQNAFFEVGFRAKATAFSQFRMRMGMAPGDYIKSKRT